MPEYDIFHRIALNWMIPVYFFLGGISAGPFFWSIVFNYWKREYKPLARVSSVLSPIFLALGMGLLILELGQPFRFWHLMVTFKPMSAASWGTWLLSIFFALNVLYAYLVLRNQDDQARKFAYAGLPFAFVVATYTGVLLAQMQGSALWHSALLPWIFLTGAIISALALAILVGIVTKKAQELGDRFVFLGRVLAWLVFLELAMVFSEGLILLNSGSEAVDVAGVFLKGNYSLLFWGLEIILGAVIPLIILFSPHRVKRLSLQATVSAFVLSGY